MTYRESEELRCALRTMILCGTITLALLLMLPHWLLIFDGAPKYLHQADAEGTKHIKWLAISMHMVAVCILLCPLEGFYRRLGIDDQW